MKRIGMFLMLVVLFFPSAVFGQEVGFKFDLLRFSTGGGQKIETILSTKETGRGGEDVALQVIGSAMLLIDTFQTLNVASRTEDGEKFEENPILGDHPSDGKIYLYMGGALVVYNIGARVLREFSEPLCTAWLKGWVTVQTGTVASNLRNGF